MSSKIGIGINENVLITKAHMTDKKQLEIELSIREEGEGAPKSLFDQQLVAGVQEEGKNSMSIRLLGPLVPKATDRNGNPRSQESRIEMAVGDIARLRNQLTQILEQFMTLDQIGLAEKELQFEGTGIVDSASFEARITDQDVLNRVYDNLTRRFIELMTPLLGKHEPVRFKLMRQSKDKHFAMIPNRFISERPFIELMSVPKEQSRVKFTDFEIKEGLNDPTPVSSSKAEKKEAAVAEVTENPFAPQS